MLQFKRLPAEIVKEFDTLTCGASKTPGFSHVTALDAAHAGGISTDDYLDMNGLDDIAYITRYNFLRFITYVAWWDRKTTPWYYNGNKIDTAAILKMFEQHILVDNPINHVVGYTLPVAQNTPPKDPIIPVEYPETDHEEIPPHEQFLEPEVPDEECIHVEKVVKKRQSKRRVTQNYRMIRPNYEDEEEIEPSPETVVNAPIPEPLRAEPEHRSTMFQMIQDIMHYFSNRIRKPQQDEKPETNDTYQNTCYIRRHPNRPRRNVLLGYGEKITAKYLEDAFTIQDISDIINTDIHNSAAYEQGFDFVNEDDIIYNYIPNGLNTVGDALSLINMILEDCDVWLREPEQPHGGVFTLKTARETVAMLMGSVNREYMVTPNCTTVKQILV